MYTYEGGGQGCEWARVPMSASTNESNPTRLHAYVEKFRIQSGKTPQPEALSDT